MIKTPINLSELELLMKEYISKKDDLDIDEIYQTERERSKCALEDFLEWLREKSRDEALKVGQ